MKTGSSSDELNTENSPHQIEKPRSVKCAAYLYLKHEELVTAEAKLLSGISIRFIQLKISTVICIAIQNI